jgi:hypothetical protein
MTLAGLRPRLELTRRESSGSAPRTASQSEARSRPSKRLRREVGRGAAMARIQADPGPGDDALAFTREELAEAWGIRE